MKRMLIALLVCALLASSIGALAIESHITDSLSSYSYVTDTYMTTEYTSRTRTRQITMDEGDYVIVSPVHRVQVNYLSYHLSGVSSSNSKVVEAEFYRQSNGQLGISLHGKSEGEAVVKATYSTFRTRLGMNYEDKRGNATFTQTFNVKVEGLGTVEMDARISGEAHDDVKGITLKMDLMKDLLGVKEMEENRKTTQDYVKYYATLPLRNFVSSLMGLIPEEGLVDVAKKSVVDNINSKAHITGPLVKGINLGGSLFNLQDIGWNTTKSVQKAYLLAKMATMPVPNYYPNDLRLTVTVTNNMKHRVRIDSLKAEGDRYLSFVGITGPWSSTTELASYRYLDPGQSATFKAAIYPHFVNGVLSTDGTPMMAYTSNLKVNCKYTDVEGETSDKLSKDLSLPTYTSITNQKLQEYKKAIWREYNAVSSDTVTNYMLGGTFNGYVRWFGYETFSQVFMFACPVEVSIHGKSGERLAVIAKGGETFSDGVITAFGVDEVKYVVVPVDSLDQYSFSVRATDAGSMSVLTYGHNDEEGAVYKAYNDVPLEPEDTFDLATMSDDAADLRRISPEGEPVLLEADARVRESDIRDDLVSDGYTQEEAQAYTQLLIKGLLPDAFQADRQLRVGAEDLDALLLRQMGELCDLDSLVEGMDTEDADEVLSGLGLPAYDAGALTVGDAISAVDNVLATLGMDERLVRKGLRQLYNDEGELVELDESVSLCQTLGLDKGLDPEASLTAPKAVLLAYRLLIQGEATLRRNVVAQQLLEAFDNSLTWYDNVANSRLYAMNPEGPSEDTLLNDTALWYPAYDVDSVLYNYNATLAGSAAGSANALTSTLDAYKLLQSDDFEYSLITCGEMSGIASGEDGAVYRFLPFCLKDGESNIYQDAVYLLIVSIKDGVAEDYILRHDIQTTEDGTANMAIIADQDTVAAFLSAFNVLYGAEDDSDASRYTELSKGDSGEDVQALQERLVELGYLKTTPDGSYGGKTVTAVSAFQKDSGLEATGVADPETQVLLFKQESNAPMFMDWLSRHAVENGYEQIVARIEELNARGTENALDKAISGVGLSTAEATTQDLYMEEKARQIPEELVEVCGAFPESYSELAENYQLSELATIFEETYINYHLKELQYTGQIENWWSNWRFTDGTFKYVTPLGESGEVAIKRHSMGGYEWLSADKLSVFGEDISSCSFTLNFTDGKRRYTVQSFNEYSGYLTEALDFKTENYPSASFELIYSGYLLPRLTATDRDGIKHVWTAAYSPNTATLANVEYEESYSQD